MNTYTLTDLEQITDKYDVPRETALFIYEHADEILNLIYEPEEECID